MDCFLNMILVVFAVFGLYCLVRLTVEWFYTPKGMQLAFTVTSREDARALPDRLSEALARLSTPRGRVLVLVPEELLSDLDARKELYGALFGFDAEILPYHEEGGAV